ncbi:pyridoxal phosphate-dependent aminotransferase [Sulfurovum sp.]|uniref:pyridoxal phosphate-dependent aminotransferase n=1 Tax=Sulfurovum sp. TaxID=1969726 RepID=UPI002867C61C|nr:pyridoxal phosphate-dependent aminotransferase [Sulfurovum sp.]
MKLSNRAKNIAQSEIRAMSILCNEKNGLNMAQGLCDLEVPHPVVQGAKEGIDSGKNTYTSAYGNYKLRAAIAKKQNDFYDQGVGVDNVLVSLGATGAFYATAMSLLNEGDEVILFEPYYGYHVATLESIGCKIKYIRTTPPAYDVDFDHLKSQISEDTKAILICNPSNPSGKVYTREELVTLSTIINQNDLFLFSDEMYEHFIYDGLEFVSALSIESLKERTVVISGFSKIYSITGWRLGYAITQKEIIDAASAFNDLIYVCPPAPLQNGILKGLNELPKSYYTDVAKEHQIKRDKFIKALNDAGLSAEYVKGAYYVLADISKIEGEDDKAKVVNLLEKTGIAAVPARAFYQDSKGINLARFCFSKKEEELDIAIERLKNLL